MKLISVNTGLHREVTWHGRTVTTGIFKQPVLGRVALRKLNLDGDCQADLSVHGGEHKAVYCYPLMHYQYWKGELRGRELPMGIFGENFTLDGLTEDSVHLGDQFAIGSAEVIVTEPRLPCYKLGIRFEADDMVKRFFVGGRTGFYLALIAREKSARGMMLCRSVVSQMQFQSRKSRGSMRPSDIVPPMWLRCDVPCELRHCLKAGRSTSVSDWKRFQRWINDT